MIINARILPTVWYSTLDPHEGDIVRIYAAIQNDSGTSFSGTASFRVGGTEVGSSHFSSVSGQLTLVSAPWTAQAGSNLVEVRIVTNLPTDTSLASDKTAGDALHVSKIITAETIKSDTQDVVTTVKGTGDSIAQTIIDSLENLKQNPPVLDPEVGPVGSVLGTSTDKTGQPVHQSWAKKMTSEAVAAVYDETLSAAQFVVTHWAWSLGTITLCIVLWRIWKKNAVE